MFSSTTAALAEHHRAQLHSEAAAHRLVRSGAAERSALPQPIPHHWRRTSAGPARKRDRAA